jgi:hypothetical protein
MSVRHAVKGMETHTHETAAQARECEAWLARQNGPRPVATRGTRTEAQRCEFIIGRIESLVLALNGELGYDATDLDGPRVTFGYIGNCGSRRPDGTYANDDRLWSVFLPHPGRVGTDEDRIGSFRTGDASAAQATFIALHYFLEGIRWSRCNEPPAVAEAREAHRAFVEDGIA